MWGVISRDTNNNTNHAHTNCNMSRRSSDHTHVQRVRNMQKSWTWKPIKCSTEHTLKDARVRFAIPPTHKQTKRHTNLMCKATSFVGISSPSHHTHESKYSPIHTLPLITGDTNLMVLQPNLPGNYSSSIQNTTHSLTKHHTRHSSQYTTINNGQLSNFYPYDFCYHDFQI